MLLFFYWPQQYFNVMKATPGMNSFIDHLALSLMREDSLGGLLPGTHAVLLWLMFRWKPTALRKCYPVFVFTRSYRIFVRSCGKWTVMCVTGHSKRAINTSGLPWPTNVSQQVPLLYPPLPISNPFPGMGGSVVSQFWYETPCKRRIIEMVLIRLAIGLPHLKMHWISRCTERRMMLRIKPFQCLPEQDNGIIIIISAVASLYKQQSTSRRLGLVMFKWALEVRLTGQPNIWKSNFTKWFALDTITLSQGQKFRKKYINCTYLRILLFLPCWTSTLFEVSGCNLVILLGMASFRNQQEADDSEITCMFNVVILRGANQTGDPVWPLLLPTLKRSGQTKTRLAPYPNVSQTEWEESLNAFFIRDMLRPLTTESGLNCTTQHPVVTIPICKKKLK